MAAPLPEALRAPVTDRASAEAWLRALYEADLVFHLEDDPGDIINMKSGEAIFRPEDVPLIQARVDACYALDWHCDDPNIECPIGFVLSLDPDA